MPEKGGTEASAYSEMPTSSSVEARMPKLGRMVPKSPVSPSKLYGAVDEALGAAAAAVEVELAAVASTGAGASETAGVASLSSLTRLAGGSDEGSIRCCSRPAKERRGELKSEFYPFPALECWLLALEQLHQSCLPDFRSSHSQSVPTFATASQLALLHLNMATKTVLVTGEPLSSPRPRLSSAHPLSRDFCTTGASGFLASYVRSSASTVDPTIADPHSRRCRSSRASLRTDGPSEGLFAQRPRLSTSLTATLMGPSSLLSR